MTEDAQEELESNEIKRDIDLNYLDIYICALATIKSKRQFDFLLRYWDKDEENTEEKAFRIQHEFIGVMNQYRTIKDEEEYLNPDSTINFDRMSQDISYQRRGAHIIRNGDIEGKDKENIIKLPLLKIEIIKHIIMTLNKWE